MKTVSLTDEQHAALLSLIEIEQSLDPESRHLVDYGDDETGHVAAIDGARTALLSAREAPCS